MSETTMKAMTLVEMQEGEAEAARLMNVWMRAYLSFPTADNFDGVLARMREYQTAWMQIAAKAKTREATP